MRAFIAVSLLFISSLGFAQNKVFSLPDLLQKVADNYPSIKAKGANINAAKYYLNAARKDYLPDLVAGDQQQYATANSVEGSYYSNEGTAVSTSGGIANKNVYTGIFGSFTTLMVDWHAFNFGQVKQSVRLYQSRVNLAQADYQNEIFQQQIKAADVYLLLALSQKLVAVQENNLTRAAAFQQYIMSRAQAGLLAGFDSSSANAEVAKAQLALLQSRQVVAQQKIQLEALSSVPAESITIDTTLFFQKIPALDYNNSNLYKNPYLLYAQQQLATQLNYAQVVKKSALPTIDIIGIGWARGSGINRTTKAYQSGIIDGLPYQAYNYMTGLAVRWDITSLTKTKQQYYAVQQEAESTRFRIEEESTLLRSQIKDAELQYNFSLQQTRVSPVQYKAALDAFNSANSRYQAGLNALSEVIQAYYVLNRADVDNAVAVDNVWRALLQHAAATGNLTEFTTQLPQ